MSVFSEFALTLLLGLLAAAFVAGMLRFKQGDSAGDIPSWFRLSQRDADRMFWFMTGLYLITFGTLSLLQHESFHSGGFDLGIFNQAIWNSLKGRILEESITIDSSSRLGHHFSPILLAFVPLYAIWSDPRVLLIAQTFALALAAFPMYMYARNRVGPVVALIIIAGYFLSPSLQSINLWEFHEIALGTLFLSLATYFLLCKRYRPFFVSVVLSLMTKEEISFIVAAFGLFLILVQKRRVMGIGYLILGLTWAIATLFFVIPFFRGPAHGTDYFFVGRYAYLGKSIREVVATAIANPGLVMQHLFVSTKIEFVLHLLVPLMFIPLVGIEVFAITLPSWAYLLLGDNPFQNSIRFQYTAPLLPFVFFATILAAERILHWKAFPIRQKGRKIVVASAIAVACIVNYYFQSAGPLGRHFDATRYAITPHTLLGYKLMDQIPANASLYSDAGFVPHLSQRQSIFEASIEFIPDFHQIDYLFADLTLPVHKDFAVFWDDVLASPQYETMVEQDGYLIKKRANPRIDVPTRIEFDDRIALLGYATEPSQIAQAGHTIRLILTWRADKVVRERYVTFVHLVDAQNHIWAQDDHEPMNGWLRTDRWNVGDITTDSFTLELPSDLPPGIYRITAGLYTTTDQKNLIASNEAGQVLGDAPVIGELSVVEASQ